MSVKEEVSKYIAREFPQCKVIIEDVGQKGATVNPSHTLLALIQFHQNNWILSTLRDLIRTIPRAPRR